MWKARVFSSPTIGTEVVLVAGRGQLLQRLVGAGDVGGVVLVVVELHDLAGDVGLERGVVVGQVGKGVVSHGGVVSCGSYVVAGSL